MARNIRYLGSIVPIISLFCLFFSFLCFDSYAVEIKINDADATNIVLKNITRLDGGSRPRFSPDGKQILFSKVVTKKWGNSSSEVAIIWVMDRDEKNKKILLENGYNGIWSPDSAKIAYCIPQGFEGFGMNGKLAIYDIKAKKKFELIEMDCSHRDAGWTKDGKGVFFGGDNVNLDTLNEYEKGDLGEVNLLTMDSPKNVEIYARNEAAGGMGETLRSLGEGDNLWIENRDKSFRRLLLPDNLRVKMINISPDLSKILFERGNDGLREKTNVIYIADLSVAKDKDLPARTFRVPIGLKKLLEESSRDGNVDPIKFIDFVNRSMEEGGIYAKISEPKINPLTKKTIDHGKKRKGLVRFVKVSDDYSIVKVVEEREPVVIGDVIWNLEASIKDIGDIDWNVWAVVIQGE